MEQLRIRTIDNIPGDWRDPVATAYCHTSEGFRRAVEAVSEARSNGAAAEAIALAGADAGAWAKLHYLFAAIVLTPDPRLLCGGRCGACGGHPVHIPSN